MPFNIVNVECEGDMAVQVADGCRSRAGCTRTRRDDSGNGHQAGEGVEVVGVPHGDREEALDDSSRLTGGNFHILKDEAEPVVLAWGVRPDGSLVVALVEVGPGRNSRDPPEEGPDSWASEAACCHSKSEWEGVEEGSVAGTLGAEASSSEAAREEVSMIVPLKSSFDVTSQSNLRLLSCCYLMDLKQALK